MTAGLDGFPDLLQRTRRFTLGEPRSFDISRSGERILFLRAPDGENPRLDLWALDVRSGAERLVLDGAGAEGDSAAQRLWRQRARESAAGITAFSADDAHERAAFLLGGAVWVVEVGSGVAVRLDDLDDPGAPVLSPDGRRLAVATGADVEVWQRGAEGWRRVSCVGSSDAGSDGVTWGRPEYTATESLGRGRALWWSHDSTHLALTRVDDSALPLWQTASAAAPWQAPAVVRHQLPGGTPSDVRLAVLDVDAGVHDAGAGALRLAAEPPEHPFLLAVSADGADSFLAVWQSRDHREIVVTDAHGSVARRETAPGPWAESFTGLPYYLTESRLAAERVLVTRDATGALVTIGRVEGRYALVRDGIPLTDAAIDVREIVDVGEDIVFLATGTDPAVTRVWRWRADGTREALSPPVGLAYASARAGTVIVCHRSLDADGLTVTVRRGAVAHEVGSRALTPPFAPNVQILDRAAIPTAVVWPRDHRAGTALPVLVASYGGPRAQMVVAARQAWYEAQWFADQGFAVLVADGRGMSGSGPDREYALRGAVPAGLVDDQVTALADAAARLPDLDLARVGIRGWSFGGYLAISALTHRPDVFHAGVAGAPVTDWRRYVGYYTETLLGDPAADPEAYDAADAASRAADLTRPLLLVQGMDDDNVFPFHALRLSAALLRAGAAHSFLPLSDIAHVAAGAPDYARVLAAERDFLRESLGMRHP